MPHVHVRTRRRLEWLSGTGHVARRCAAIVSVGVAVVVAGCGSSPDVGIVSSVATAREGPTYESPYTSIITAPADHIPRYTGIRSPSGNIGCLLTPSGVGCDILQRDWSPPPRPADCRYAYGRIAVSRGGPAHFVCAGDSVYNPGAEPLAYGEAIIVGVMRCESAESGITCRDDESGHGFTISRESYRLF